MATVCGSGVCCPSRRPSCDRPVALCGSEGNPMRSSHRTARPLTDIGDVTTSRDIGSRTSAFPANRGFLRFIVESAPPRPESVVPLSGHTVSSCAGFHTAVSYVCSRVPPLVSRRVIPVARKVRQPIASAMPAAVARRRIIRQASGSVIGLLESTLPLCPRAARNNHPTRSSTSSCVIAARRGRGLRKACRCPIAAVRNTRPDRISRAKAVVFLTDPPAAAADCPQTGAAAAPAPPNRARSSRRARSAPAARAPHPAFPTSLGPSR
jgi:hypothetical protein